MRDDGQVPGSALPPEGGNGLVGMRERVAVYGGELVARSRPEGGFELMATLPLDSRVPLPRTAARSACSSSTTRRWSGSASG